MSTKCTLSVAALAKLAGKVDAHRASIKDVLDFLLQNGIQDGTIVTTELRTAIKALDAAAEYIMPGNDVLDEG